MEKSLKYEHSLPNHEVYSRISRLIPKLEEKYSDKIDDAEWKWNEEKDKMKFSLSIEGYDISGKLRLKDNVIKIKAEVPFTISMFWGKIEKMIRLKISELLK